MKERMTVLALFKPPACWRLNFSTVAPSCGDTINCTSACKILEQIQILLWVTHVLPFYHCYYNPHLTSFHTLPLTVDLMSFYMTLENGALYVYDWEWNDKRPIKGWVIWAYSESYDWATVVQINLRYTGTSIYLPIFVLFFLLFFLLTVHVVSVNANAVVSCLQEKKWGYE